MNYILTPKGELVRDGELYHYGIKGQKWGVRRFQNPDGSLTPAGKKRVSKEYKNYMQKAQADQARSHQRMVIDAYNDTADEYNRYKIAEYNKKHSPDEPDYVERYEKQFAEDHHKNYTKRYLEFTKNNENYKKGKALADKYGLYKYDELAKANKEAIDTMESYVNGLISREETERRVQEQGRKIT